MNYAEKKKRKHIPQETTISNPSFSYSTLLLHLVNFQFKKRLETTTEPFGANYCAAKEEHQCEINFPLELSFENSQYYPTEDVNYLYPL